MSTEKSLKYLLTMLYGIAFILFGIACGIAFASGAKSYTIVLLSYISPLTGIIICTCTIIALLINSKNK